MDKISKSQRSWNMSRIKGKNTRAELQVRRKLFSNGLRYRIHVKDLPGKPDIAIKKYGLVVEVRGCFWHGHTSCVDGHNPKTNTKFWQDKIEKNIARDIGNIEKLKNEGFTVFEIWECEVNKTEIFNQRVSEILDLSALRSREE